MRRQPTWPLVPGILALATLAASGPSRAEPHAGAPARTEVDLDALRERARAARPPAERRRVRPPELVDVARLEPEIRVDLRFASSRNFLGAPLHDGGRALLQRPVAEALVRAHRRLARRGLGLLVWDAYRPWYVTRLLWDGTPPAGRAFVADPARGSRHNRGCAVDLTLYDLATGLPVEMPSEYVEMSRRASPRYRGGPAGPRRRRDELRAAMEAERFRVAGNEWWHFNHRGCRYGILNVPVP